MCESLIDEGMSVARLNFSHGTHQEHRKKMSAVLEAVQRKPGSHVAILLDTKGPEIRTGLTENGKPIFVKKGQLLDISMHSLIQQAIIRSSGTKR